jgi:germacradienol/geosmin synthase
MTAYPYELPTLCQPVPARLNPHVSSAGERSRSWAREMGLLDRTDRQGARIWDEPAFASMRIALLAAYRHPDASPEELDLLTGWYVWMSWLDDHVPQVCARPRREVKAYLDGFAAFIPEGSVPVPSPANPGERALADLWPRTVTGMPPGRRRRFAAATRSLLQGRLRERDLLADGRAPNPIEYVGLRRAFGSASWSTGLVEHVLADELPGEIVGSRPFRVLRDAFADAVHLCGDLYSYRRVGGPGNGVAMLERFLGCDPQTAADRVNDLRTARLRQLETTAATDLPELMVEQGLDPEQRARVVRFVRALREFESGSREWHERSGRQVRPGAPPARRPGVPTGLGTSAALPPPPNAAATPGYPFLLPDFHMPWTVRLNPHHAAAHRASRAWAGEMGMIGAPGGLWSGGRFEAMEFAKWCAMTNPGASAELLELTALWFTWIIALGDHFVAEHHARGDLAAARLFAGRLPRFMPLDGGVTPAPVNCVERGLADLWARTAPRLPRERRSGLRDEVLTCCAGNLWELANSVRRRIPDPIDYIVTAREAKGSDRLALLIQRLGLPDELQDDESVRELRHACADHIGLVNDIVSYRLETEVERQPNNGVLTVCRFLDCDLQTAVDIVNDQLTACVRKFQRIVRDDLAGGAGVAAYVEGLQNWMSGNVAWHLGNRRYLEPGAAVVPRVPRNAGISAGLVSAAPAPSDQGMQTPRQRVST